MVQCIKCERPVEKPWLTAYGEHLCENCWDGHLMTDRGKVEYFLGICNNEYSMDCFDADFLGHVVACWREYRDKLNMTKFKINEIEQKAKALGLL